MRASVAAPLAEESAIINILQDIIEIDGSPAGVTVSTDRDTIDVEGTAEIAGNLLANTIYKVGGVFAAIEEDQRCARDMSAVKLRHKSLILSGLSILNNRRLALNAKNTANAEKTT